MVHQSRGQGQRPPSRVQVIDLRHSIDNLGERDEMLESSLLRDMIRVLQFQVDRIIERGGGQLSDSFQDMTLPQGGVLLSTMLRRFP